jgi:glutamate-1-semialdehyde 2,1-aminomutase
MSVQARLLGMHSIERSLDLYERAKQLMPGAAQLISRRPTRGALGISRAR